MGLYVVIWFIKYFSCVDEASQEGNYVQNALNFSSVVMHQVKCFSGISKRATQWKNS
jgi:hypothetical protein